MNVSQKEALNNARRVLGFAAMGVLPSPVKAQMALNKLVREIPAELQIRLVDAKTVLQQLATENTLPTMKKANGAMDQVKEVKDSLKLQTHSHIQKERDDDEEQPSEDLPRM
jgi:hypothetical protein